MTLDTIIIHMVMNAVNVMIHALDALEVEVTIVFLVHLVFMLIMHILMDQFLVILVQTDALIVQRMKIVQLHVVNAHQDI